MILNQNYDDDKYVNYDYPVIVTKKDYNSDKNVKIYIPLVYYSNELRKYIYCTLEVEKDIIYFADKFNENTYPLTLSFIKTMNCSYELMTHNDIKPTEKIEQDSLQMVKKDIIKTIESERYDQNIYYIDDDSDVKYLQIDEKEYFTLNPNKRSRVAAWIFLAKFDTDINPSELIKVYYDSSDINSEYIVKLKDEELMTININNKWDELCKYIHTQENKKENAKVKVINKIYNEIFEETPIYFIEEDFKKYLEYCKKGENNND